MAHDPGGGVNGWHWTVTDHYVQGHQPTALPTAQLIHLVWNRTSTGAFSFNSDFVKWGSPNYPALWITGLSFQLVTSAVAGNRRPIFQVVDQTGETIVVSKWAAGAATAASSTAWYEMSVGVHLESPGALTTPVTVVRDGLPGMLILQGNQDVGVRLELSIQNVQVGDVMSGAVVRGVLIP